MHRITSAIPLVKSWCSTPFGDIDGCTKALGKTYLKGVECSTPFGDIDGCTFCAIRNPFLHFVLNAFRRH